MKKRLNKKESLAKKQALKDMKIDSNISKILIHLEPTILSIKNIPKTIFLTNQL